MTRLTLQLLSFLIELLSWNKYILHFRQQPYRYIYIYIYFFFNFQLLYFQNRIVVIVVNGDVNRALVQQSRAKEPTLALSLFLSQPLVPFFLSLSRSSSPGVALDGVTASARTKRVLSPPIRRYESNAYIYAPPFAYPGVTSGFSLSLSSSLQTTDTRFFSLSLSLSLLFFPE